MNRSSFGIYDENQDVNALNLEHNNGKNEPCRSGLGKAAPLVVPVVIALLMWLVGPVSSLCINPARAFGPAVITGTFYNQDTLCLRDLYDSGVPHRNGLRIKAVIDCLSVFSTSGSSRFFCCTRNIWKCPQTRLSCNSRL